MPVVILEYIRSVQYKLREESGDGVGKMKEYYVCILSNKRGALYTGITNNLERRIYQHKNKLVEGFTKKYNITRLVYFESCSDVRAAIEREKEIKGLLRSKKVELIKTMNPRWDDLSATWSESQEYIPTPDSSSR